MRGIVEALAVRRADRPRQSDRGIHRGSGIPVRGAVRIRRAGTPRGRRHRRLPPGVRRGFQLARHHPWWRSRRRIRRHRCALRPPRSRLPNRRTRRRRLQRGDGQCGRRRHRPRRRPNLAAAGTPRRTVIVALWDAEEDGLLGSAHYANDPLVPIEQTVAYVNFDIQGSDLLPSIANSTIAVGAETGGAPLVEAVTERRRCIDARHRPAERGVRSGPQRPRELHRQGVPSVFLTDATNACYHTTQDDLTAVQLRQARSAGADRDGARHRSRLDRHRSRLRPGAAGRHLRRRRGAPRDRRAGRRRLLGTRTRGGSDQHHSSSATCRPSSTPVPTRSPMHRSARCSPELPASSRR